MSPRNSMVTLSPGDISREEILSAPIVPTILRLAYPILIAMSFHTLFNFVDTYFVSRLGAEALASMGLTFPFFMFTVALTQGLGIGTSSLVARSIGAQDKDRIIKVAGNSISLAILAGLTFAILGLIIYPQLLSFMGAKESIAQKASSYLRIMFCFLPLKFLLIVLEGLFRGEGKTSLAMRVMLIATLSNILLDPLLIFGLGPFPAMGIAGASLATAISWFIGILLAFYFFYSYKTSLPLKLKGIKVGLDIYWRILKIGLPASLSTASMSMSMFFLNRFAYQFGSEVVAAYAIGFRIDTLTILPGLSIAAATIAMVGQNYGAYNITRAKKAHLGSSLVVLLVMGILSLIILFFPQALSSIFIFNGSKEGEVLHYSTSYLRIVAISYPLCGLGFVSNCTFQAMDLGLPPLFNALLRFFMVTLPASYLLAFTFGFGPIGIFLGIALANIVFGLVSFLWVKGFLSKLNQRTPPRIPKE